MYISQNIYVEFEKSKGTKFISFSFLMALSLRLMTIHIYNSISEEYNTLFYET